MRVDGGGTIGSRGAHAARGNEKARADVRVEDGRVAPADPARSTGRRVAWSRA